PALGDAPSSYVLEAGSATGLSDLVNTDTGGAAVVFTADNVPTGTYFVRVREEWRRDGRAVERSSGDRRFARVYHCARDADAVVVGDESSRHLELVRG